MLASAGRTYLNHFGVAVGKKVASTRPHDSAYEGGFDLRKARRRRPRDRRLPRQAGRHGTREARSLGIEVLSGHLVVNTAASSGLHPMSVARNGGGAIAQDRGRRLLVSAGWTPSVHLFSQSRGKVTVRCGDGAVPAGNYARNASPSAPAMARRPAGDDRRGTRAGELRPVPRVRKAAVRSRSPAATLSNGQAA